jgi:DNA-binding Xre family transcriptional regulator
MMEEQDQREGIMYIRIGAYLDDLRNIQHALPADQRREVPTMTELAREIGISKTNFSKIARGHVNSLNLDLGRKLIRALRRRGFDTKVQDIVTYVEIDPNEQGGGHA